MIHGQLPVGDLKLASIATHVSPGVPCTRVRANYLVSCEIAEATL
jgi:hypothetical protein